MGHKYWPLLVVLAIFGLIFSYRLLSVPTGLTVDEAAFGYNASLLAKTGRDENMRRLPVFVLSIEGRDWRQPVTQYYLAALFAVFGPSVWLLRFSSVILALVSAGLLYWLLTLVLSRKAALIGTIIFLATPVVFMHARLGLDNLMPVPWTLLWLIGLVKAKEGKFRWWWLAGLALGINFYSYKAMRAVVPVWTVLTLILIWFTNHKTKPKKILWFGLGLAPFVLAIPILERLYPGAVFDRHGFSFGNVYDFLYPYLSSFDLSFLFIKGDSTWYHSTQKHGMFLLTLLPLWLAGLYWAVKEKSWLGFWLAAFFTAPLLYGMVNSVHRASRLIYLVPLAAGMAALAWQQLEKHPRGKILLSVWAVVAAANFLDFTYYYFSRYPVDAKTNNAFSEDLQNYPAYQQLATISQEKQIKAYVSADVARADSESGKFFETIYFGSLVEKWANNDQLPPGPAVMLSLRENIPGAQRLEVSLPRYYLQQIP